MDDIVKIDGTTYVEVEQGINSWCVKQRSAIDGPWEVSTHEFEVLPIKRPYCLNKAHVEFIEGDWNQEKTQYGIRIGFTSGAVRCFWGETGRKVLETIFDEEAGCPRKEILNKYDERVKAGPPTM